MAKRTQQELGEERVTAKSRPMMNLIARMPSAVSSSASSKPGMTSYGYQDPERSVPSDDRTRKPVSVHHPEQAYSENFVMGSDEAEIVNKVKNQVRNRQKRMSNVAESGDEHSIIAQIYVCDVTRLDERGGSTQRHDDVDKCANDLRHEMALEIWIVSVHEKSEQL